MPLLVFLITGDVGRETLVYALGGGLALLLTAYRGATWWATRYEVTDRQLRVRSGLVGRREQFVPLERIHAVDLNESLLQRLFGVVEVKIETAAGGTRDSDVALEALSRAEAATLRTHLRVAPRPEPSVREEAAPPEVAETAAGARLIRALSPTELLVAGATAGRVGPALAILFGAYQLVDDLVPDPVLGQLAAGVPGLSPRGVVGLALAVGLGAWLLALVSTIFTFAGFELRRDGDRLAISSGLLERRRSTIPLARVQAVVVTEGILRQPFGLAAVRIESAGYGRDSATSGVLFPLVARSEVPTLLARACPDFDADLAAPLARPPGRARRRYVGEQARGIVILAVLTVGIAAATPASAWWWGLAPLGLLPLAVWRGLLRYRDTGWALDGDGRLVVRGRQFGRVTTITTIRRLQRRSVSQHPLQQRARLANLRVAVASGGSGGRIAIRHLDEAVAFDLLARLGPARAKLT